MKESEDKGRKVNKKEESEEGRKVKEGEEKGRKEGR